jgi:hypothetical protein
MKYPLYLLLLSCITSSELIAQLVGNATKPTSLSRSNHPSAQNTVADNSTFMKITDVPVDSGAWSVIGGDWDGDGDLDLSVACRWSGTVLIPDTSIGKKDLTTEIAGSAFRKRATGYFLVIGKDTSDYMVVFSENKDDGKVMIDARYDRYNKKGKLFKTRLTEFKKILRLAQQNYNLDSLSGIGIGRLVSTGDLAVEISKKFSAKYGDDYEISDYKPITDFLFESDLRECIDTLFEPYSVLVKRIGVEKVFFTSKRELYFSSLVEADSSEIPARILDCITWIYLEKKHE